MVTAAEPATPRGSARETSETVKNWIDILKSLVAFLLVGLLLFLVGCDRERLKAMAQDMGISEISGPGVKVALATSSDALPRNEAALKEAQAQIRTLREGYSRAVNALRQVQQEPSATAIPPGAKQAVAAILERAPETLQSSQRTAAVLSEARDRTSTAIAQLPGAGDSSLGYGVVFGGDRKEDEARDQLNRAQGLPGNPQLFRRQGFYRSVVMFPTREAATAALPRIKAINRYSADAYIVTLASWCPGANLGEDPVACNS